MFEHYLNNHCIIFFQLHFVFYNSDYKDLEEADNKTDGVVVIVIMIQVKFRRIIFIQYLFNLGNAHWSQSIQANVYFQITFLNIPTVLFLY